MPELHSLRGQSSEAAVLSPTASWMSGSVTGASDLYSHNQMASLDHLRQNLHTLCQPEFNAGSPFPEGGHTEHPLAATEASRWSWLLQAPQLSIPNGAPLRASSNLLPDPTTLRAALFHRYEELAQNLTLRVTPCTSRLYGSMLQPGYGVALVQDLSYPAPPGVLAGDSPSGQLNLSTGPAGGNLSTRPGRGPSIEAEDDTSSRRKA